MIHAKDINEQSKWQELTPGCEIYEPATASMTITGEWRTMTDGAEVGCHQVQAVSAVRTVLSGFLDSGCRRQASGL